MNLQSAFRGKGGFTLAELLVVAVVAFGIAAVIMPALARTDSVSAAASCTNNLRQLGSVIGLYSQDYGEWVPISGGWQGASGVLWPMQKIFATEGYLRRMDVWVCPSMPPYRFNMNDATQTYAPIRHREISRPEARILPEGMEDAVELVRDPETGRWNPGRTGQAFLSLPRVSRPSDYFLIVERSHIAGYQHTIWGREHAATRLHMRHGTTTNMLFADGSARACGAERVRALGFTDAWSENWEPVEF